jgi:hypothetical protein
MKSAAAGTVKTASTPAARAALINVMTEDDQDVKIG